MEPVSLTVGAVVARLVARAAEKAEEEVVGGVVASGLGVLGRLVDRLRKQLTKGREEAGIAALTRLEDAPDSPSRMRTLAETLDRRAAEDEEFRGGLEELVAEARFGGVNVDGVVQSIWGNQSVATANIVGSHVTVNYGQPTQPSGS